MSITRVGLLIALIAGFALSVAPVHAQTYSLPNNNNGCPSGCRQIPWLTGSDLWNGGTLPVYPGANCSPLSENGTTDDTTNINNCITAANAGTGPYAACHTAGGCAVLIPAGTVFVNGTVRLKSNVVVRGAGGNSTFINEGASGGLTTQNFSRSGNLNPPVTFATLPSMFLLTGTPHKGDTQITLNTVPAGGLPVGSWIKVVGNDDPSLVSSFQMDYGGDNTGFYLMQQFEQIVSYASGTGGAGSIANISRPLYYPPFTTAVKVGCDAGVCSEPAGAKYNIITFPTQKAGFENMKVSATGDNGASQIILMQGCLFCWVKGVQTYNTGSNSGSAHVEFMESYGGEIRDGDYHDQRSGASGAGYGIDIFQANGDIKVENNIIRHNRHGIIWEGGGSGTAILYNYIDDEYTDDLTYVGSARSNHGAHPFMSLFEGNIMSHMTADDFHGSGSHIVFFRNWLWGDESGIGVPGFNPAGMSGFNAIDVYTSNPYYSFVGNVLGINGLHTTWSAATLRTYDGFGTNTNPVVYSYAGQMQFNLTSVNASGVYQGTISGTNLPNGDSNGSGNQLANIIFNITGFTNPANNIQCITTATSATSITCGGVATVSETHAGLATWALPSDNATSLNQGNWDMKTNGIAFNEDGTNDTFAPSWYYSSQPLAWWKVASYTAPWPPIGSDITGGTATGSNGKANMNPARACYVNVMGSPNDPTGTFDASLCYALSTPSVAVPTFAPSPGIYATPQTVTISTSTVGATICYTVDGSTPTTDGAGTCTHGTAFSSPVLVSTTQTIRAIGTLSGDSDSAIASATYTISTVTTTPPAPGVTIMTQSTLRVVRAQ